ncbi:hypothetical protein ACNITG_27500, partial [Escherichia coli]
ALWAPRINGAVGLRPYRDGWMAAHDPAAFVRTALLLLRHPRAGKVLEVWDRARYEHMVELSEVMRDLLAHVGTPGAVWITP